MATYKLIPSSWSGSVASPSNAYNDTTNTTYATVGGGVAYLGGFDFSVIPQGHAIISITVKFKAKGGTSHRGELYSGVDGVPLSEYQSLTSTATVYELQLSEPLDTILGYLSTLCIKFNGITSYYVYGAEINVEAVKTRNKVIYGNETLIDLTGDTATASDVAVGKTFHLASGKQATGTLSPLKATATTSSSTARTVSFTVSKEPSWFMMICSSANTTARNLRVLHMLYDGTTTTTYYTNSSTAFSIATSTSYGSFTYSSGTLTISIDSSGPYLGGADWELYYL